MKAEDNKKQDELKDEQLDNVAGGGFFEEHYDGDVPIDL